MAVKLLKRYWPVVLFAFILIISSLLMIMPVIKYNFPFTMDQGHDMLDIRQIVVGHRPALVGPPTSIPGLFHGPFWYYLMSIPFAIGGGNPSLLVYTVIFFYILGGISLFLYNYKNNTAFAIISSLLFLLSPPLLYQTRYALNSNIMPVFAVFFFLLLIETLSKPKDIKYAALGLLTGILLQIEAGSGIIFLPYVFLILFIYKTKMRNLIITACGFGITLIPQLMFEFRHNFIMTKSAFNALTTDAGDLGVAFNALETIKSHLSSYNLLIDNSLSFPHVITYLILTAGILYFILGIRKNKLTQREKMYLNLSIIFIFLSFTLYIFYRFPLKGWFLNPFYVPLYFIFSVLFSKIYSKENIVAKIFLILLLIAFAGNSVHTHQRFIDFKGDRVSGDPSNLKNELSAIDLIYKKAGGKAFSVYNYMPSILDYPYQYLFWWYGAKTYGYHPQSVSYLDNVPEYIKNNDSYFRKKITNATKPDTFLLIEQDTAKPERVAAWLGNFSSYCTIFSEKFAVFNTEVRQIEKCK